MVRISVVVPAYNVEKYIARCLDSIFASGYPELEVIVVNDGSTDSTLEKLEPYRDRIILIDQKNQGLSMARNNGIRRVTGEYFLLVDSDDYVEKDLFEVLSASISDKPDLVRFQIRDVYPDGQVTDHPEQGFELLPGSQAFEIISGYFYVEAAVCYLYRTDFFRNNGFAYMPGVYHEDYGLTPLVIVRADRVRSLEYIGYDYRQNDTSIMHQNRYETLVKKADDVFAQYLNNRQLSDDAYFRSFMVAGVITRVMDLNDADFQRMEKKLMAAEYYNDMLDDNVRRKLKKAVAKRSLKRYIQLFR